MRGGGARRAAEGGAVGGSGVPRRIRVLENKQKCTVKTEMLPIEFTDQIRVYYKNLSRKNIHEKDSHDDLPFKSFLVWF